MVERRAVLLTCTLLTAVLASVGPTAAGEPGVDTPEVHEPVHGATPVDLVSVNSDGQQANGASGGTAMSANGRFVAFSSAATNLVPGDTNGVDDVFLRDRWKGITTRVSVDSAGHQANGASYAVAVSADGRWILFNSMATDLTARDANQRRDVFAHNRLSGMTRLVSVGDTGATANGRSDGSAISANGSRVAFSSSATNLVRSDTNGAADAFVRDLARGVTRRVSVSSREVEGKGWSRAAGLSATGRYVLIISTASNLAPGAGGDDEEDVFLRDRVTGRTRLVDATNGQFFTGECLSLDGQHALLAENWYGMAGISLRDFAAHRMRSITAGRVPGDTEILYPDLSAKGRIAVYFSATVLDRDLETRPRSYDGILYNRTTDKTTYATLTETGQLVKNVSPPAISADGQWIAFASAAPDVVAGDENGVLDVFVRRR